MDNDPEALKAVMRNFSKHSRLRPSLAKDIISIDGLNSQSNEFWLAWKDAVLDLACDASDQNHLFTLIKRSFAVFGSQEQGQRATCILSDLAKIVPSSLEIIMKHLENSFPYWKTPQSGVQLEFFTRNSLKLGIELPQLSERIIDFLTRKILLIDSSIRSEDVPYIFNDSDTLNTLSSAVTLATSSNNVEVVSSVSGFGEKYSKEERAKEVGDAQIAHRIHLEQVRDFASKVDLMISALLEYIQESSRTERSARDTGLFVLISFEKNILAGSVKPKFVQFLIYYAARKNVLVADRFLGSLVAFLFSKDAQLSSNNFSSKASSNTPAKAKSIRIAACFLSSFVKNAPFLTDSQIKSTSELLVNWIGRKVEALAHFSKSNTEVFIIASVVCCLLEMMNVHPELICNDMSSSLNDAIKMAFPLIPIHLKACKTLEPMFSAIDAKEQTHHQTQISPYSPFDPLELPHCKKILYETSQ